MVCSPAARSASGFMRNSSSACIPAHSEIGAYSGYFSNLVPLTALWLLLQKNRPKFGPLFSLWRGLFAGLLMAFVASLVVYVFLVFHNLVLNPGWLDEALKLKVDQLRAAHVLPRGNRDPGADHPIPQRARACRPDAFHHPQLNPARRRAGLLHFPVADLAGGKSALISAPSAATGSWAGGCVLNQVRCFFASARVFSQWPPPGRPPSTCPSRQSNVSRYPMAREALGFSLQSRVRPVRFSPRLVHRATLPRTLCSIRRFRSSLSRPSSQSLTSKSTNGPGRATKSARKSTSVRPDARQRPSAAQHPPRIGNVECTEAGGI